MRWTWQLEIAQQTRIEESPFCEAAIAGRVDVTVPTRP